MWEGRYPSQSEADLALAGALAFWAGPDEARIDALFRRSGLYRPKWDERRSDATYGSVTIARALAGRVDFYRPRDEHDRGEEEHRDRGRVDHRDDDHRDAHRGDDDRGEVVRFVGLPAYLATPKGSGEALIGDADAFEVILPAGGLLKFYGAQGASKTTLAVDLVAHLASGTDWHGKTIVRPVRVAVIENEGPAEQLRQKLARKVASWTGSEWTDNVVVLDHPHGGFDFRRDEHRESLRRLRRGAGLDLIVADPTKWLGIEGGGTPDEEEPEERRACADEAAGRGGRGLVRAAEDDPLRRVGRLVARRARTQTEHRVRVREHDELREARVRERDRPPAHRRARQGVPQDLRRHEAWQEERQDDERLDEGEAPARPRHLLGERRPGRLRGPQPRSRRPEGRTPTQAPAGGRVFENDELPRLFAALASRGSTYRVLFAVALKTGMRQGELLALTWGDVDLVNSVIHVRRTHTDGNLGSPKNHEKREVFVTDEVVELLGSWWGECGKPFDERLLLPGETKTGYLNPQVILRRELYPAMERAGIPRVGPTGEKRTFHSLRHTFARIAIEHNRPIFWLSKHLGHSSLDVTSNVYGHFEKATRRREAEAMAGMFGV